MCHERRLVAVFVGDRHLPIAPISVERGIHRRVTQAVDAIVHARDRIRVQDGNLVELTIIDAKARSAVLFRSDDDRGSPFTLRGLDDFCSEHLRYVCSANQGPFLMDCPLYRKPFFGFFTNGLDHWFSRLFVAHTFTSDKS